MLGTLFCCFSVLYMSFIRPNFVYVTQLLMVITFVFSLKFGYCSGLYSFLSFSFSLDSMSTNLIILSFWCSLLMILGSFYISKKKLDEMLFLISVVILMIILFLSFLMTNLLMFYICFELSLVPTFYLIMKWGYQPERIQASLYMLLYTICASLSLLITMVEMNNHLISLSMVFSFEPKTGYYVHSGYAIFLMLAFFVKMPLYFTHLWLPKAHVEAPVAGSMVLAGVLLKLGSYGLIRVMSFCYLFMYKYSEVFMSVSLVGGVLTSMICVVQSDLKSLIAYSSIGHMGVLTGGILSMSWFGIVGAVIMMVAHGLCSSGMFFLSNTYYQNSKSRSVLMNKGVLHAFPFMVMFSFLVFSCNMSAPPSINLAGELILCMGILSFSYVSAIPVALMTLLSGGYSMYLYVLSSHGNTVKMFGSWKQLKNYDIFCIALHFLPIWGIILNLKMYI
uniref:NADH-ubiquinone oxidoreductase chain 4 n=1 Tax=Loxosomella aloxiata TaxID=393182 RepID=B1B1X6_9BILA|nr:NADH dehydrogenase subunit 4 [Loxosomella aloxiata]BAG12591.1 NADH dehydrogenase subunit 4 [Loxosomella aloxiata]